MSDAAFSAFLGYAFWSLTATLACIVGFAAYWFRQDFVSWLKGRKNVGSKAMYIPSNDKVAMIIGRRRVMASWDEAVELLAELQVIFHERQIFDPDGIEVGGDDDE